MSEGEQLSVKIKKADRVKSGRLRDPAGIMAELLTQLARTLSLQRKFDDVHKLLDDARQLITEQPMPVAEICYLLERGRTFNSANERAQAIGLFKEAYEKALQSNEEFYAIDAAHMLGVAEKGNFHCKMDHRPNLSHS